MALELGEVRRALGVPRSDESDGIARHVDAAGRELCRIQDELWPFPRPGSGLIETLKRRTAWLLATPLAVAAGEGVAALPEADVQAVADVAELILAGLGSAGAWDRPIIVVRADPDLIFLELNMTPRQAAIPPPAARRRSGRGCRPWRWRSGAARMPALTTAACGYGWNYPDVRGTRPREPHMQPSRVAAVAGRVHDSGSVFRWAGQN